MKNPMMAYVTIFEECKTVTDRSIQLSYNVKVARSTRDNKPKHSYPSMTDKKQALALAFQIHNDKRTADLVFQTKSIN